MSKISFPRPRVAIIGFDEMQTQAISRLCGSPRPAPTMQAYLEDYDLLDETDIVVASDIDGLQVFTHVMAIASTKIEWVDYAPDGLRVRKISATRSRAREMSVASTCPHVYREAAGSLVDSLRHVDRPPPTFGASLDDAINERAIALQALVESGQQKTRAARFAFQGIMNRPLVGLVLPQEADAVAWFRSFLADLHEADPERVPQLPPSPELSETWHTPDELWLGGLIQQADEKLVAALGERDHYLAQFRAVGKREEEEGMRRVLYADGEDLEEAVGDIFQSLGFTVRDMDAETPSGEPKREDFRLTGNWCPDWEALVEVKGYKKGVKSNDTRQLTDHREAYNRANGHPPDQALWVVNPHRLDAPASRPPIGSNIADRAETAGWVCINATDLYRLWTTTAQGATQRDLAIMSLVNAEPGAWDATVIGTDPPPDS